MTTFTPREIKNRKFKQSLMGIDAEEVKSFLKLVAAEFDKILTQNAQLEKKLTEQTVKSTLTTKKEAEKNAERNRQALEEAGKTAGEIIARAKEEAEEIRQKAEREAAELQRKTEREAQEKARRETALMLSQAKVMADEITLNAKQKAQKIEAEARAAAASLTAAASRTAPEFERPLSIPGRPVAPPENVNSGPDEWDMRHAEEAQKNFDSLMGEAMARAEAIIQSTRAEAEMITSSLTRGRTLGELNKEHEHPRAIEVLLLPAPHEQSAPMVLNASGKPDQSLLQREIMGNRTVWHMLELIREYAATKLDPVPRARLEQRRAEYFSRQLQTIRQRPDWKSEREGYYQVNASNLLASLNCAIYEGRTELGFQLLELLDELWWSIGYMKEGLELVRRLMVLPDDSELRVRAGRLQLASDLAWQQHDFETALAYSRATTELGREHGLKDAYPWDLNSLGRIYIEQENFSAAKDVLRECLDLGIFITRNLESRITTCPAGRGCPVRRTIGGIEIPPASGIELSEGGRRYFSCDGKDRPG